MNHGLILNLLGNLCIAFTCINLLPLCASLLYDFASLPMFLGTMVFSGGLAFFFKRYGKYKENQRMRIREAVVVVGMGWILVCSMGAIPYFLAGDYNLVTALFESTSGFTTTGVTTVNSFHEFSLPLRIWRCLTHWCGGIGVIMLFIIIMPRMNNGAGYLFNAELPGGMGERTLHHIKESARFMLSVYLGLTTLNFIFLLLAGLDFWHAMNASLATVATGGFSFYHDSLVSHSIFVDIISIIFMLSSSVNYSIYYKILRRDWAGMKEEPEHRYYFAWLFVACLLIIIDLFIEGNMSFGDVLRFGIFQTVSVGSTTGFASVDFDKWPAFTRYVLFVLMFVGGCSNSTAGGIKISRMVILLKASWAELLRTIHPRIVYTIRFGKRIIDPSTVGNITRFFFLYILVFIVLTILISISGVGVMDSMGLIAALLSSVGPAFGIVGPTMHYGDISTYGRCICIIAMLLGRLEIFTILVVFQPDFWTYKKTW